MPDLAYSENIDTALLEAGRRVADVINQKIADHGWWEIKNKWLAFSLADGRSDGTLYDTNRDAVRHQSNEQLCAYICLRNLGNGATAKDSAIFLKFVRDAYKAGFRLPDPDDVNGGPTPAMTTRWHDHLSSQLFIPSNKVILP